MKRKILKTECHASYNAQKNESGNPHFALALRSSVIGSTCFFSSCFDSFFIHFTGFVFRKEMAADEKGIYQNDDRKRNTDECEFEESEGRKSCSCQCTGYDNVRWCTDHRDGTAYVSCDSQRHQLTGRSNFCSLADTDDNRHQAGNGSRIRRYGRQNDGNKHDSAHQRNFIGSCFFYYP